MRALCWHGKGDVRVDTVPDPGGRRSDQGAVWRHRRAGSFLSDIFPTGYMAAVNAQIQPGDTVAIWGC